MKKLTILIALLFTGGILLAQQSKEVKILMVLSSHETLGNTGKTTGFYLSEATHAYEVFEAAGYQIDMVSPKGGKAPVDGFDLEDAVNKKYWEDETFQHKINRTLSPAQVAPEAYDVIYYAGGHGTMWDFPENEALAEIAAQIYEQNGIVAAVCHGPSALVNIKLSDGSYLVEGKDISAFSNQEERAVELEEVVPFSLEDRLLERGATIVKGANWSEKVSVDGRLVTGQNPASAHKVATEIVSLLKTK
ncbi:type 1 glutamine amidotransferase domain-containing protein [Echinicola sediminis]